MRKQPDLRRMGDSAGICDDQAALKLVNRTASAVLLVFLVASCAATTGNPVQGSSEPLFPVPSNITQTLSAPGTEWTSWQIPRCGYTVTFSGVAVGGDVKNGAFDFVTTRHYPPTDRNASYAESATCFCVNGFTYQNATDYQLHTIMGNMSSKKELVENKLSIYREGSDTKIVDISAGTPSYGGDVVIRVQVHIRKFMFSAIGIRQL